MSVNPVSPSPVAAIASLNQNQQKPAAAAPAPASQQDTVHLSSEAKAAAGDVDHGGDNR